MNHGGYVTTVVTKEAPIQADPQIKIRLPIEVKAWISEQAHRNGASQNSEIIRSIRDRMDRAAAGEGPRQANPAAEANASARHAG
jgi:hypothetical protein